MNGKVNMVNKMYEYEYVSKKQYQPVREELEDIIKKVQDLVRDTFTFQFKLVGSGGRHLITRIKDGNQGFDFDYNLILNPPKEANKIWNAKFARTTIKAALEEAIKNTKYNKVSDTKSGITIKVVDHKNSKILHSCDFSVVYYPDIEDDGSKNSDNFYKYARFDKSTSNITWEIRNNSRNYDDKLEWLQDNLPNYWVIIKEEYLLVKNSNKDENKHSFQLYLEAVCNIFNQFYNEDDDSEEDDYYYDDDADDDDDYYD